MNKTITFDNNIVSFNQYVSSYESEHKSVLTIIGEIHNPNNRSTVSQYIQTINNTDETFVFLELDTNSVNDETYMRGIQSSVIKDVVTNFRTDHIFYFDNRNELLGRQEHYNLYHGGVPDINYYIDKYVEYTKSPYLSRRHTELDQYVELYKRKVDENNSLSNMTSGRSRWMNNIEKRNIEKEITDISGKLINGFREFWANVIDENLLDTISQIVTNNPTKKFEIIVIVGERHAQHLDVMILNTTHSQLFRNIIKWPSEDTNKPFTLRYRGDTFWDDMETL